MNARAPIRFFTAAYLLLFFAYLFGPLIIMSVTAFNSSAFPRMIPWECLTFEWFGKAANDTRLKWGLQNSAVIGAGVVLLSVTLGLAGALFLTQVWPRARAAYYTVIISPVLMPGVVLGISTILFWDRTAKLMGASTESGFYNGIFLTILGQSSFIASYCMLIFIARLQRFDTGLMEAALDLGATQAQAFRKILLPFLKPAIGSAAVLAFLASFENYNTTVFTISHYNTFTTEIAQKVRLGIDRGRHHRADACRRARARGLEPLCREAPEDRRARCRGLLQRQPRCHPVPHGGRRGPHHRLVRPVSQRGGLQGPCAGG
jgi:spermidine/putrescine transport system permease protein